MPAQFDIDKILDKGPSVFDPNDKLVVETPHDPKGDQPVDTELFERVMSGEKLEKKDLEVKPPTDDKKTAKPSQTDEEKLAAEEAASAKALEEKTKKAEEAERLEEEEAKKKEKVDEDKPKLPPTAKPPTAKTLPEGETSSIDSIVKELGLPDTAVPLFKKMDKSARDYVVAEIKRTRAEVETTKAALETAKKSIRNDIPANWYEHKQAYALTPEFQGAVNTAKQMKGYAAHFREQLINIEQGEDWIDLQLDAQGNIRNVPRKTTSADAVRIKYELLDRIKDFDDVAKEHERKSQQIAGQFIEYHKNLKDDIKAKYDEYFPQYADEAEFAKNEWGNYAIKMLEANGQGHNPIAGMFARLYAFALETQEENQKLKAANGKGNIPPVRGQGPTGAEIDNGAASNRGEAKLGSDDSPFTEDEFERLKTRGQIL